MDSNPRLSSQYPAISYLDSLLWKGYKIPNYTLLAISLVEDKIWYFYIAIKPINCIINSKISFVIYDAPTTCFGLYMAIFREAVYKVIQIQKFLSKMLICRVKIKYYQIKLPKIIRYKSITKFLHFLTIFSLSLPTYIDINFFYLHSERVILRKIYKIYPG